MSDTEKAEMRAAGALDEFTTAMLREFDRLDRSDAYRKQFWDSFFAEVFAREFE